jgi:hypothetical protein
MANAKLLPPNVKQMPIAKKPISHSVSKVNALPRPAVAQIPIAKMLY